MYRDYDGKAITQDFINTNDMYFMINHTFKYISGGDDLYADYFNFGCHLLIVYCVELIIQHIALLTHCKDFCSQRRENPGGGA